ncbi:hypothetical protein BDF20DRAFT_983177 [Mycotypha africana]|uniref:uncharacterized protein n=1 Tax=Mycotypha africana TaxID=64632 RepID=UPI0023015F5E|nr:uncharacterized protein BDF20DRAFT_983177 [Mycotypha africana]KAI8967054.1 hypothetical protein BDF20DRAFT_983177 [Mycotypha africana]
MNTMSAIGVNHKGFNQLLSTRFYTQIVRTQLEYGLAISSFSSSQIKKIEECQTECIRRIFGGNSRSSTKVMLHLTNLQTQRQANNSVLLSSCRPFHGVDPTLWLPMTPVERSRVIRWRLGWLPGGVPKPCIHHPNVMFTRKHSIICLTCTVDYKCLHSK